MVKGFYPKAVFPRLTVSPRGATRLKNGHPWVYRSDLSSANGIAPGSLVSVVDPKGRTLGTALYSSSSQIAIRLLANTPVESLPDLIRERIRQAIEYRKLVVSNTDAYRIIFSEADFLPGLIVDRYNDLLSLQILTQAMDSDVAREAILSELEKQLAPAAIVERVDARVRQLEQLPRRDSGLLRGTKTETTFTMNGIAFQYSALQGQKTGAFLDQRENYAAAEQYAHGEALDVFCYQGAFALHLARRCSLVTGVDSSRSALEIADQNAARNGHEIDWIEANAFDLLQDYAAAGNQYDTIVLDPPAFAKSRKNLETAMRGYKELNLRALKMLRPGGILVSCTCSYHVGQSDFLSLLAQASADAHRKVRILETRGQAKDHPVLLNMPETGYLKSVYMHISA
ncbi:MAG TPA: class I SAM-dependent rRNA methyltransferase [Terriglobales bacterium]|nr:class I SAM-dependent rRNA methyltransferase [Terriglobales bacterium]